MRRILLTLLAMVLIAACAPDDDTTAVQPVEGVIRNYETGEPIPDAFVVARWFVESGGLGHGGGAICFHVEVMKTDAQGSYRFPVPNIRSDYANVNKPDIFVVAYKPGYRWAPEVNYVPTPADQLIETDETSEERMKTFQNVIKNTDCDSGGDSRRTLLPLYQAMYADANQAAVTRDDRGEAIYILRNIESIQIGGEAAYEKYEERMRGHR
jgi:hypothetical protein